MTRLVLLNKPYGVLSQFRQVKDAPTLADYIDMPGVHPAGRLDKDSEGLLLLTDDGRLQHRIAHPAHKRWKTYWAQVEGEVSDGAIAALRRGITLKDGPTRPARAHIIPEPDLWPRDPPIRFRARIPTTWLEIGIHEGRNRQIRRMTAQIGAPTLRLVRIAVGRWRLGTLKPGEWTLWRIDSATRGRA